MTLDFEELVGPGGSPEELAELREVHELLLSAAPPPSFAGRVPRPARGRKPVRRSRAVAALSFAGAASIIAGVAIGLALGHGGGFQSRIMRPMHGLAPAPDASALIQVGREDAAGNRALRMTVRGLPASAPGSWYVLYLTKRGNPVVPCGVFVTGPSGTATVSMNAPGDLAEYDGWIVTAAGSGHRPRIFLTT